MSKKTKKLVWIVISCLTLAAVLGTAYMLRSGYHPEETVYLLIDEDDNYDSVCQKIEDIGHPADMTVFHLYAEAINLKQRIRTGRYEINDGTSVLTLVKHLRNHQQTPVKLLVPSVRTLSEMAGRLSRQLMLDSLTIVNYMRDESHLQAMGYTSETLPALFIPNTYEVYWDITVDDLFARLQKENTAFWNMNRTRLLESLSEYAGEEMTKEKVVTLASIVDSETSNNSEKPTIAALYMNRMRRQMALQSDPTVIFAVGDFTIKRVLHEHLKMDSPYNTYRNIGLPPGPIRIPSIAGIDAVLNHDTNDYIYMCAKEDFSGTHNFAISYAEHQSNAARYTNALNERGIH